MTSSQKNYSEKTDEALIELAKNGDIKAEQCIIERYKDSVRITAAAYVSSYAVSCSISSLDFDDLFQEGLSGLLSAIYSFREEKNVTFRTYSAKCISNGIKAAIKAATRKKNTPTGGVVSLYDIEISTLSTPEDKIISEENTDLLFSFLGDELSSLESSVIRLHIEGKSYKTISEELGISEKSVGNALQRIRGKLSRFLEENRS